MKIGTLTTQTMQSGALENDKTYNLYFSEGGNPFLFVSDGGKEIPISDFSAAGVPFTMNQSLQYDGVPVAITEVMSGSAMIIVLEKMAWQSSPDVGEKMWVNFGDPYLRYTGE